MQGAGRPVLLPRQTLDILDSFHDMLKAHLLSGVTALHARNLSEVQDPRKRNKQQRFACFRRSLHQSSQQVADAVP